MGRKLAKNGEGLGAFITQVDMGEGEGPIFKQIHTNLKASFLLVKMN